MLRFAGVTRAYGPRLALDGVSFDLAAGSFTALVGPNGSGKSTLLRLAATLETPTSGRVTVDGHTGAEARLRLAWVGHEPGLYEDLTVRENLAFAAAAHGRPGGLEDAAAHLGATPHLDARVRSLSRGERQRAALARALLGGDLLLLDEPTTGLDADAVRALSDTLASLAPARTILVATHDAELVKRADRVLTLADGRLAA